MKEKINKTLSKMQNDIPTVSSPNSSSESNVIKPLGDPNCPHCGGVGYVRYDVSLDHEKFGKIESCICRARDVAESARARLFAMSNLNSLSHLTFENFNPLGNDKAVSMTMQEREELHHTWEICEEFAQVHKSWLLLEGKYGSGKTHLAAAIANYAVNHGVPTLFITVPDLLDSLRFAYADPEITFEQRFEDIRNANMLILDDFGTQNATAWAQEKLFQIINYRYINKLATVITTNLMLDEIEGRIRSRLQDDEFVTHLIISAPDYRRPTETSNPGISTLSSPELIGKTFVNFQYRENELGKTDKIVVTSERKDNFGNRIKEKEITNINISQKDIDTLKNAIDVSYTYALNPTGWLILLGQPYCGKTHLAAAIGHYREKLGGQVTLIEASDLLDYLKQTFQKSSDVSFDRRFYEMRNIPLLILDNLKESNSTTVWAEDKLHQILYYRYNMRLPTVITSALRQEAFALSYPSLWYRILDVENCQLCVIDMSPYRRVMKTSKTSPHKKK
ncbi:MAG TPA: ATP-binding protein [Anaerolineales bacterium]|nr:ATP-binding protein [Anaerolineales bacterium]